MDNRPPHPPPPPETPPSDTQEQNSTFTFPTSTGGISFSIRPVGSITNISPNYFQNITIPRNINRIYYDPIFRFLPIGGGAPAAGPNSVLNASLYDKETYKNVLSDEGKEQIIHRKYDTNTDEVKTCPIMFTDFEDGEEVAELPCKHIFDKDAIEKWLKEEDASCPVCRKKLNSKEVKNEDEAEAAPPPRLPTMSQLVNTLRERQIAAIDNEEERMLQIAIEESLRR